MAKTKLSNEKRETLLAWMMEQYDAKHADELKKPTEKAIKAMNTAIRKRYPEADMAVLRKYNVTRQDHCLRFVDEDTRQVFGFDWGFGDAPKELADVPGNGGCRSQDTFVMSPSGHEVVEALTRLRDEAKAARQQKQQEYRSFLDASRCVEDVHEVVPLPEEMQRQCLSGMALIPVSEALLASIKKEFAAKA